MPEAILWDGWSQITCSRLEWATSRHVDDARCSVLAKAYLGPAVRQDDGYDFSRTAARFRGDDSKLKSLVTP
jgi:hypothetical protein